MKAPYIKTWTAPKAACGNIYRVLWNDGSESGYPASEIRAQAINALS